MEILPKTHPDYYCSQFKVMVELKNGYITSEPLQAIEADNPVTCAIYAKSNSLLDTPGWKQFKSLAKHEKKFTCMVNMAKMRSFNTSPRYKYGFMKLQDHIHKPWFLMIKTRIIAGKMILEFNEIDQHNAFIDNSHHTKSKPPMDIRGLGCILYLMSNMMDVIRQD
jgi:hypothetical protein